MQQGTNAAQCVSNVAFWKSSAGNRDLPVPSLQPLRAAQGHGKAFTQVSHFLLRFSFLNPHLLCCVPRAEALLAARACCLALSLRGCSSLCVLPSAKMLSAAAPGWMGPWEMVVADAEGPTCLQQGAEPSVTAWAPQAGQPLALPEPWSAFGVSPAEMWPSQGG